MLSCLLAEYIIRFDNDQTNKSSDFDMPAPKVKLIDMISQTKISFLIERQKSKRS
jgi:hypothetical protein